MEKVGDVWKLSQVAAPLDFSGLETLNVPTVVNGKKVKSSTFDVLPGAYTITTGLKHLHLGSKNVFTVTGPSYQAATYDLQPKLTKDDKKASIAAAKKSFGTCLKTKSLRPKNCPFSVRSNGNNISTSTIKWTQQGSDPFKKARVEIYGTEAYVSATFKVGFRASCNGGTTCSTTINGTSRARVSLRKDTLKARWAY